MAPVVPVGTRAQIALADGKEGDEDGLVPAPGRLVLLVLELQLVTRLSRTSGAAAPGDRSRTQALGAGTSRDAHTLSADAPPALLLPDEVCRCPDPAPRGGSAHAEAPGCGIHCCF